MLDLLTAVPAHGLGIGELPLPRWLLAYMAAMAVVLGAVALRAVWLEPRFTPRPVDGPGPGATDDATVAPPPPRGGGATALLTQDVTTTEVAAPSAGRRLAAGVAGAVGVAVWALLLGAGLTGNDDSAANIAPIGLFVAVWIGLQGVSAVAGDVWRALSPFEAVARMAGRGLRAGTARAAAWTAPALVGTFVWLELAAPDGGTPRVVGQWLVAYTVLVAAGTAAWGRAWLRTGEGFAAVFGAFARLAPVGTDAETGRLRLRPPLQGLGADLPAGWAATMMVVLGALVFDGVTTLDTWRRDIVGTRSGASADLVATLGLAFATAVVAAAVLGGLRLAAARADRDPFDLAPVVAPALVPAVFGWAVAHSFALFAFELQNIGALASDPFGTGRDLFGTREWIFSTEVVGPATVAWVQVAAVAIGHVAAVVVVHDRLVAHVGLRCAIAARAPLVGLAVVSAVAALALLLGS